MRRVNGLHHITAISGNAQQNLDFYAGVLGMRLVKKSVNQDDPGTYHLFYADAVGHPGSDLTFFPWDRFAPPVIGHGLTTEVELEVPAGTIPFWSSRLQKYGVEMSPTETRFGNKVVPFVDPHGLKVALVEAQSSRPFEAWDGGPVAGEYQVRGLFGARVWERDAAATAEFLERALGFERLVEDAGWTRYWIRGSAGVVDIRETPSERRGRWGVGSVHHLAWRVDDEEHQLAVRDEVIAFGGHPTPVIDRFWFKSVYFKEPGGVLFELATDGPGFAVDEDPRHLGEGLVLPPFLEPQRRQIETVLPELRYASASK